MKFWPLFFCISLIGSLVACGSSEDRSVEQENTEVDLELLDAGKKEESVATKWIFGSWVIEQSALQNDRKIASVVVTISESNMLIETVKKDGDVHRMDAKIVDLRETDAGLALVVNSEDSGGGINLVEFSAVKITPNQIKFGVDDLGLFHKVGVKQAEADPSGGGKSVGDLRGEYICEGLMMDSLSFRRDGDVYVSLSTGMEVPGTYKVDGDKVPIKINSAPGVVFTRIGNTLVSGQGMGRLVCTGR